MCIGISERNFFADKLILESAVKDLLYLTSERIIDIHENVIYLCIDVPCKAIILNVLTSS